MREQNERIPKSRIDSRSNIIPRRINGNRLPATNGGSPLRITGDIYSDDGRTGVDQYDSPVTWLHYRLATAAISIGTFGYGIGLLSLELWVK